MVVPPQTTPCDRYRIRKGRRLLFLSGGSIDWLKVDLGQLVIHKIRDMFPLFLGVLVGNTSELLFQRASLVLPMIKMGKVEFSISLYLHRSFNNATPVALSLTANPCPFQ